jgi:hypothetical protein
MEDAPVAMAGNTSGRSIHRMHTREIASSGEPDLFQFVDPLDLREDSIDAFLIIMVELERIVNFRRERLWIPKKPLGGETDYNKKKCPNNKFSSGRRTPVVKYPHQRKEA